MVRRVGLVVCALLGLLSCRSAPSRATNDGVAAPPVAPQVALQCRRGALNIDVTFQTLRDSTSPLHQFVFSIDTIRTVLQLRGRANFDTTIYLLLINGTTGLREKVDSISTHGMGRWSNPLGLPLDTLHCRVEATTLQRQLYVATFDTVFAIPPDSIEPFMTVTPFIDNRTDSSITFALLAQRHRGYGEDYHPTSERLRVEILDERGVVRFASNHGMNFLQAIYPVEPKIRGELKRFTYEWRGVDNDGKPLPPGRYTAVLSLVAKPYPYVARIEFDWPGRKQ